MTSLEILTAYRATVQEIDAVNQQLKKCALPCGPNALRNQLYDGVAPGTNDPTAAAMQRMDGLEELLMRRRQYLLEIAAGFESIIQSIDHPETAVIIRRYYGLGESDAQVAEAMGKSAKWIMRLRHRFINTL